jgi:hypothetical protein
VRVAKAHPIAGWLRIEGHTYSRTLDKILAMRDADLETNPNASGLPSGARDWFWLQQLPALITDPKIREQCCHRLGELASKHTAIDHQLRVQAGNLIDEQAKLQSEMALLEQVLTEGDQ